MKQERVTGWPRSRIRGLYAKVREIRPGTRQPDIHRTVKDYPNLNWQLDPTVEPGYSAHLPEETDLASESQRA